MLVSHRYFVPVAFWVLPFSSWTWMQGLSPGQGILGLSLLTSGCLVANVGHCLLESKLGIDNGGCWIFGAWSRLCPFIEWIVEWCGSYYHHANWNWFLSCICLRPYHGPAARVMVTNVIVEDGALQLLHELCCSQWYVFNVVLQFCVELRFLRQHELVVVSLVLLWLLVPGPDVLLRKTVSQMTCLWLVMRFCVASWSSDHVDTW